MLITGKVLSFERSVFRTNIADNAYISCEGQSVPVYIGSGFDASSSNVTNLIGFAVLHTEPDGVYATMDLSKYHLDSDTDKEDLKWGANAVGDAVNGEVQIGTIKSISVDSSCSYSITVVGGEKNDK